MLSAREAILKQFGAEHRSVLVPWRALLALRRATIALPRDQRRWTHAPESESDLRPVLRSMQARQDLKLLMRSPRAYQITAPYARTTMPDPFELLIELNPYGAISHASALAFHGFSLDLPEQITAMTPLAGKGDVLPVGTEPIDWFEIDVPDGAAVHAVLHTPVTWQRTRIENFFGFGLYRVGDVPIRITTPERTLVEGLRHPELCGGISNVLAAWTRARYSLDLEATIATVDRFDTGILRQRVGYILERLGLIHPVLEQWREGAMRGGSSKLVAAEPFVSRFSERWQISLNGPIELLGDAA